MRSPPCRGERSFCAAAARPPLFVTASAPPPPLPPPLWQRLWRRPAFKRAFYEVLGLALFRSRGFEMLNCGWHRAGEAPLALSPGQEHERCGYALYHQLARSVPMAGADVLEVACGRAAGARFLAERFAPRSYLATDASRMLVAAARRRPRPPNLRLLRLPAERLDLPPASFDICLAVEAMSLIADKAAFLASIARLLRPGGALLVADFFYARPSSPNALDAFLRAMAASPLRLDCGEDWTGAATAALELVSPVRLARIARLPRPLRRPALAFAGTTESPLYRQLTDGRACYRFFRACRR
jgi:SAM-dependent methyltransferase